MKYIQYVMCDRKGDVRTFKCPCAQSADDQDNLELWRPEQLRGTMQQLFNNYLKKGYALSNWHVVELKDKLVPA